MASYSECAVYSWPFTVRTVPKIPVADVQGLHRSVGWKDKMLKVFKAPKGGAQHCQRDNMSLGVTYIAN